MKAEFKFIKLIFTFLPCSIA